MTTGEGGRTSGADDDRNDEAVDSEHTSHDDGHDRLHDQLGSEDTHGGDTDARLGCAIRRTKACERWKGEDQSLVAADQGLIDLVTAGALM